MPSVQSLRQFVELDPVPGLRPVAMDSRAIDARLQRQSLEDVPVGDAPILVLRVQDVVRRHRNHGASRDVMANPVGVLVGPPYQVVAARDLRPVIEVVHMGELVEQLDVLDEMQTLEHRKPLAYAPVVAGIVIQQDGDLESAVVRHGGRRFEVPEQFGDAQGDPQHRLATGVLFEDAPDVRDLRRVFVVMTEQHDAIDPRPVGVGGVGILDPHGDQQFQEYVHGNFSLLMLRSAELLDLWAAIVKAWVVLLPGLQEVSAGANAVPRECVDIVKHSPIRYWQPFGA